MTLSVTAKSQSGVSPMMKVTATSTTSGPSPVPDNTQIRVWRNHADGSLHRVLTGADPRLIGGVWTWLDAHCPFNQPVTYTVTAVTSPSVFSAQSAAAWLLSKRTWLIHPTQADLAVSVDCVSAIGDQSQASRSARFAPLERKAIFLSDGLRDGEKGSITFRVAATDVPKYRALLNEDSVILINTPGTSGWDVGWLWVQPGDVSRANKANLTSYPYRDVTLPYEECADPDVEFEPDFTYSDVPVAFSTYAQVAAAYATYADLVTDTRL